LFEVDRFVIEFIFQQ